MLSDLCTLHSTHCTISVHPFLYELGQTKHTYGTNTGLSGYGSASAACCSTAAAADQLVLQQIRNLCLLQFCKMVWVLKKKKNTPQMGWEGSRCTVQLSDPKGDKFRLTKAEGTQRRQQQTTQGSDLVSCSAAVRIASLTTSLGMRSCGFANGFLVPCEKFKICDIRNCRVHKGIKYSYAISVSMLSVYLFAF